MSSTREVAYDIVVRWKQDIGKTVKYEQMIADIDEALRQREQEVRTEERERCAKIAQAWLFGSLTDPDVLESVGKYAASRCKGILGAIKQGLDVSQYARGESAGHPLRL